MSAERNRLEVKTLDSGSSALHTHARAPGCPTLDPAPQHMKTTNRLNIQRSPRTDYTDAEKEGLERKTHPQWK